MILVSRTWLPFPMPTLWPTDHGPRSHRFRTERIPLWIENSRAVAPKMITRRRSRRCCVARAAHGDHFWRAGTASTLSVFGASFIADLVGFMRCLACHPSRELFTRAARIRCSSRCDLEVQVRMTARMGRGWVATTTPFSPPSDPHLLGPSCSPCAGPSRGRRRCARGREPRNARYDARPHEA
jgi:hypothetical protein